MIWAKILFTIGPIGHYADQWVMFRTSDMKNAVYEADAMCTGYYLGCGLKASVHLFQTVSPGIDVDVFDPYQGAQGLFNKLQSYRDKHKS